MANWYDALPDAPGQNPPPQMPGISDGSAPAVTPSATDIYNLAQSRPNAAPVSQDDAAQMANDLQQVAARKAGQAQQGWWSNLDDAPTIPSVTEPTGPTAASLVKNLGAGANNAIASTLGAPVDAAASLMKPPGYSGLSPEQQQDFTQRHPTAGAIMNAWNSIDQNPLGGSNSIKSLLGLIGANPDDVQANNGPEQVARAAGSGAVGMLAPFAGARAALASGIGKAGPLLDTLANGSMAGNTAIGAGAGAGGQIGSNAAQGTPYQPFASLLGSLLGGGAVGLPGAAAKGVGTTAASLGQRWARPFTSAGRETMAAGRLQRAATNPMSAAAAADEAPDMVPGSKPTLAQASSDPGLAALERTQATKNPDQFNQRRAEQQGAQVQALDSVQPTGDPAAVGNFIRQRLGEINARGDAAVDQARTGTQQQVSGLGGNQSPQEYGQALRGTLEEQKSASKAQEKALWEAIDPDKKLALDVSPARAAANRIANSVSSYARPIEGEEAQILGKMRMAPQVMKFADLTDLRSRLLSAIRSERFANGQSPALARMQQLRQAIDETIATGADRVAQQEQDAVGAGEMDPQRTLNARMENEIKAWYNDHDARSKSAEVGQTAVGRNAAGRPGGVYPVRGDQGQAGGRPGNAPGSQGVQSGAGDELAPNFDAGAAQRYRNAADTTREAKQTFGTGATGQVLRSGETFGSYRVPDSHVAAKFFNGGSHAAEDVQSFLRASGGRNDAVDTLQDYAASSLRKAAETPDGTLDPRRFAGWMNKHADALSSFPELQERFANAARAQETLDNALASRAASLKAQQGYTAQKFIGTDPVNAVQSAFRSTNPSAEFAKLARWAGQDRTGEATAGLRRAVVENMQRQFLTESQGNPAIKAQQFQNFLRQHRAALGYVLPGERMKVIEDIAADLARTNPVKGKLAGGSNTAQDVTGVSRSAGESGEGHGDNVLSYFVGMAGEHAGGLLTGAAAGLGTKVASLFRNAGLKKVDNLVTEAMLNPELGRTLLMKTTGANKPMVMKRLSAQLKTMAVVEPGADDQKR